MAKKQKPGILLNGYIALHHKPAKGEEFPISRFKFPILLQQQQAGYKVIAGKTQMPFLTYDQACREIGEAVLHALELAGHITDDRG